jgi:glycosyltransferase involved in cell wall biosynthesis/putative flippase GtrA
VTSSQTAARDGSGSTGPLATVEIVVPVHNEEVDLEKSVARLVEYLHTMPFTFHGTIADNASTDATALIADRLAEEYDELAVVHLALKGRGRALRQVWSTSSSPVVAYMDVDLSTDLNALLPLVAPLLTGHSDIAIGTRLSHGARVQRGAKREVISRCYNMLLRGTLRARFSDAQCGFKAMRGDAAVALLPWVRDDSWFFDTELLVLADRAGLRIHEVAVDWVDDPDSRVDVVQTASDDLRGIVRLGWSLLRGDVPLSALHDALGRTRRYGIEGSLRAQSLVFTLIGVASTVAYACLYLCLRPVLAAQTANAVALVLTAVGNTAANRRMTFGISTPDHRWRHHAQALLVLATGLLATGTALSMVDEMAGPGHRLAEITVLTVANLLVTVVRFAAMRIWIFRAGRGSPDPGQPEPSAPVSTPLAHDQA